ncbi:hypothetical protein ACTFIV_004817 [Dictyostelium citrinum]
MSSASASAPVSTSASAPVSTSASASASIIIQDTENSIEDFENTINFMSNFQKKQLNSSKSIQFVTPIDNKIEEFPNNNWKMWKYCIFESEKRCHMEYRKDIGIGNEPQEP